MNQESFLPHHVKIMKVALAISIIRQKPPGVSAKEYTTRLALQFSQLQTNWREKATHLKRELLRTKQELTAYQINCEVLKVRTKESTSCPHHSQVHPIYHDVSSQESTSDCTLWTAAMPIDNEWVSSGYSSSLPLNETSRAEAMVTVSRSTGHAQITEVANDQAEGEKILTSLQERVRTHVKFCSTVYSLASLHEQLSDLVTSDLRDNLYETITDALIGLTESLQSVGCFTSGFSLPHDLFITAAACIADCLQLPLLSPFRDELVALCSVLVSTLIQQIIHCSSLNKSSLPPLCSALVVLCALMDVFIHALTAIVKEIVKGAENLRKSLDDVDGLDMDVIENFGVLLQTTDTLLTQYGTALSQQEVCVSLTKELESSLVGLIETFPLFSYSVWKVIAYLNTFS